jgi:hypothetical protein
MCGSSILILNGLLLQAAYGQEMVAQHGDGFN